MPSWPTECSRRDVAEVQVIGQAVKNLSEHTKSRKPQIPWKQIAGMRDKVIHDYFGVNLHRLHASRRDSGTLEVIALAP